MTQSVKTYSVGWLLLTEFLKGVRFYFKSQALKITLYLLSDSSSINECLGTILHSYYGWVLNACVSKIMNVIFHLL